MGIDLKNYKPVKLDYHNPIVEFANSYVNVIVRFCGVLVSASEIATSIITNSSGEEHVINVKSEILNLIDTETSKSLNVENKPIEGSFGFLSSGLRVLNIPSEHRARFEQYLRYVSENSRLFSIPKEVKLVEVEYSYDDKPTQVLVKKIVSPLQRKYFDKRLSKLRYLNFEVIESFLGFDKDIVETRNSEIAHWEEFSKYLGSLKPGEIPQKPEWMSVEQWADIKAMAMKESWDEQIAFNNKMVQPIPEEVALAMFELQKRNKQTETKSDGNSEQVQAPQQ